MLGVDNIAPAMHKLRFLLVLFIQVSLSQFPRMSERRKRTRTAKASGSKSSCRREESFRSPCTLCLTDLNPERALCSVEIVILFYEGPAKKRARTTIVVVMCHRGSGRSRAVWFASFVSSVESKPNRGNFVIGLALAARHSSVLWLIVCHGRMPATADVNPIG